MNSGEKMAILQLFDTPEFIKSDVHQKNGKMKKLIYGSLLIALLGIGNVGCKKNSIPENRIPNSAGLSTEYQISNSELNSILKELHSDAKVGPGWWRKFKDWVNSHSGSSQNYVNGQPSCSGGGGCGPCAGICFSSGLMQGSSDGTLTLAELNAGVSAFQMTLIEKTDDSSQKKLFLEIPNQHVSAYVMNSSLLISDDVLLPEWFVKSAGLTEIKIISGRYPVLVNPDGSAELLVNIAAR